MSKQIYLNRSWHYYETYLRRFRSEATHYLDMGCGYGLFMQACLKAGKQVAGCDHSPERIQHCRQLGLTVYEHDLAEPLHFFPSESFDAVFCNQVIEHVDDRTQHNLLSEAFRVLVRGGELLVCSPCRHYEPARLEPGHINLLTPKELEALLLEAGFGEINLGYNYPQSVSEIPKDSLLEIWKEYRPDLLSQTATALATK